MFSRKLFIMNRIQYCQISNIIIFICSRTFIFKRFMPYTNSFNKINSPDVYKRQKYALTSKHILVTRTFSKLFSMAGCRLGYVVGHPDEIKMVQKLCTPHNTNAFAMLVAQKILETPGILSSLIEDLSLIHISHSVEVSATVCPSPEDSVLVHQ